MEKRGLSVAFILAISILAIGFASADFSVGNLSHSIFPEYGPDSTIIGWTNMSFTNEPSNSMFSDSFGNSIRLIDLLKKNTAYVYNCSTFNCSSDYTFSNPQQEKNFSLAKNSSGVLGVRLTGNIEKISSVELTIESDAAPSCINQLKIDFSGDNVYDFGNNKTSSSVCSDSKNYSCFEIGNATEELSIGTTFYCQKIMLNEAPGFNVGAWARKVGAGAADLAMWLYDGSKYLAKCSLPEPNSAGEEISCDLSYLVATPKEYSICINAQTDGLYRTRANLNPVIKCGSYGTPPKAGATAYQIFAQQKQFDNIGSLKITNTLPNGANISSLMESYIINKYKSLDCTNKDCVVPIKIFAGENQTAVVKGLNLVYKKRLVGEATSSDFYDLVESPTKISSKFQKLYLDEGNFVVPSSYGRHEFELELRNEPVFSEYINVSKVPVIKDLIPKIAALGISTKFTLSFESAGANITSYKWVFDGSTVTTTKNEASYAFSTLGIHNVTITIKDANNKNSTKRFEVNVSTSKDQVGQMINNTKKSIIGIKSSIKLLPVFYQEGINSVLNLSAAETSLSEAEILYNAATDDDDYVQIINKLITIDLPDSIGLSRNAEAIPLLTRSENTNLDFLAAINGDTYNSGDTENYKALIAAWSYQNIDATINFQEIAAIKGAEREPLLRVFKIDIKRKGDLDTTPYFISDSLENLKFKQNYDQQVEDDYFYIPLEDEETNIEFATTEDIDFVSLPAFISPALSDFPAPTPTIDDRISKWLLYVLIIALILIGALIVYVVMHQWYRNKYETHLFGNRNHLFNIISYINVQKKNKVQDKEIIKNLKKAGWNSEQIDYAMKKYHGKSTGMVELPFMKWFRKKTPEQGVIPTQNPAQNPIFGQRKSFFPDRKPF